MIALRSNLPSHLGFVGGTCSLTQGLLATGDGAELVARPAGLQPPVRAETGGGGG